MFALANSPGAVFNLSAGYVRPLSLGELIQSLKDFYAAQHAIPLLMGGKLSIKSHYTYLTIITNKERKDKEKELKEPDLRPTTHETIFQPKEPILLEDLFEREELKNALKKRLLIQGSAGIGKSTLCQRIAYYWAQEEKWLGRFQAVFWVKFRDLNRTKFPPRPEKGYTIYEVLSKLLGFELGQIEKLLEDKEFRENCFLVLDGYDELPNDKLDLKMPGNADLSVLEAFQQEFSHLIVTTRPQTMPNFSLELVILGFENKAINKYVESFFRPSEEDSKEVLQRKEQGKKDIGNQLENPLVFSLCHIPINLEIFCSLAFEGKMFPKGQSLNLATIYKTLTDWLIERFGEKHPQLSELLKGRSFVKASNDAIKARKYVEKVLEAIAWDMMLKNTLYCSLSEIQNTIIEDPEKQLPERISEIRSLNLEEIGPLRINEMGEGQFIHLTFQEFFAAKYLAGLFLDGKSEDLAKATQIIAEKKFHLRYQLVFSMTSGLLAQNTETLRKFFDMLYTPPRDLGESRQNILLARYFEECGDSTKDVIQYEEFIQTTVKLLEDPHIFFETKLDLLHRNHFLLNNEKVKVFFLKQLEDLEPDSLELLKRLIEEKNRIPEEIFTENMLSKLMDLLSGKKVDVFVHQKAASALNEIAKAGRALPEKALDRLIDFLSDAKADMYGRMHVAKILGEITKAGRALPEKALDGLIDFLSDAKADKHTRQEAAETLKNIAKAGKALPENVLKRLIDVVSNAKADKYARQEAANILGKIAKPGEFPPDDVLYRLIDFWLLDANDCADAREQVGMPFTREEVVAGLEEITKAQRAFPEKGLDGLIDLLLDTKVNAYTHAQVAAMLGAIARTGRALPEKGLYRLIDLLSDEKINTFVRGAAAIALGRIAKTERALPEKGLEGLIEFFFDAKADGYTRREVAEGLEQSAKAGKSLPEKGLNRLMDALSDAKTNDLTRNLATVVLVEIAKVEGIFLEKALKGLIALLLNPTDNANTRGQAAFSLGAIARTGRALPEEALKGLIALLSSPTANAYAHMQAARALKEVVKAGIVLDEKGLKGLIGLLSNPNTDMYAREQAARALKEVVKAGTVLDELRISKISERAAALVPRNKMSWERPVFVELLEEIIKIKNPCVKRSVMLFLSSIDSKGDYQPKHIERFLVTFLKAFPKQTEEDKDTMKRICKISGIAFYEENDRCYASGKSLSSAHC